MWPKIAERLQQGETVTVRPRGGSMTPKIMSGQQVTIEPCSIAQVRPGDVVLARVRGRYYLHYATAVRDGAAKIENAHGFVNGWSRRVFGRVVFEEFS